MYIDAGEDGVPSQAQAAPYLCNGVHVRLFDQFSDYLDSVSPVNGGGMAHFKESVQKGQQLVGVHSVRS